MLGRHPPCSAALHSARPQRRFAWIVPRFTGTTGILAGPLQPLRNSAPLLANLGIADVSRYLVRLATPLPFSRSHAEGGGAKGGRSRVGVGQPAVGQDEREAAEVLSPMICVVGIVHLRRGESPAGPLRELAPAPGHSIRANGDERDLSDRPSCGDLGRRDPGPRTGHRDGQAQRPGGPHARALLESPGLRAPGAWVTAPWLLAVPRFAAPGSEEALPRPW